MTHMRTNFGGLCVEKLPFEVRLGVLVAAGMRSAQSKVFWHT